jgi:hypothetical protein
MRKGGKGVVQSGFGSAWSGVGSAASIAVAAVAAARRVRAERLLRLVAGLLAELLAGLLFCGMAGSQGFSIGSGAGVDFWFTSIGLRECSFDVTGMVHGCCDLE